MTPGSTPEPFRILFVCTGNTCRSPLAEVLARTEVARRGWTHVEVRSAGAAARDGAPASEGSLRAAEAGGLDLSGHRSTALDSELVEWADLVLVMSRGHLEAVRSLGGAEKVELLGVFASPDGVGSEVPDPFGADASRYAETFRVLEELVVRTMDRLEPILAP